jgi:hypothetical protein
VAPTSAPQNNAAGTAAQNKSHKRTSGTHKHVACTNKKNQAAFIIVTTTIVSEDQMMDW